MEVSAWISALALLMLGVGVNTDTVGSRVPAMFIFGDSLIDPGNNNNLITLAKANYLPHGIDFPGGPTGRFCNGRTVADYLGNVLGLPLIPPFNNPSTKGSKILQGVNFASAASGILNDTGKYYGDRWTMDEQIQNFKKILVQLGSLMTSDGSIEELVANSLYFVSMGSNDYLNNYLWPGSAASMKYTLEEFHELVIREYTRQLKTLYKLGGRKFVIGGLGPLGCIPMVIANSKNISRCSDRVNEITSQFNTKVIILVSELNKNLTESSFLYWDIYAAAMKIIHGPTPYGFKHTHKACCGGGRDKGQIVCLPLITSMCGNRSQYVFWDTFHPTDAVNGILAKEAFQGNSLTTHPMTMQQIFQH